MRKLIALVLVLFFIPLFTIFLLMINLRFTLFSANFIKNKLDKSGIYEKSLEELPKLLFQAFPTVLGQASDPSIQKLSAEIFKKQVKPEDVQKLSDDAIDQVYAILYGGSNDFTVEIPLKDIKGKLESGLESESGLEKNDPLLVAFKEIPDVLNFDLSPKRDGLGRMPPNLLDIFNIFTIIFGGLVLGFLFIIALVAGGSLRARIRWVSLSLLIPSFLLFIYSLVASRVLAPLIFNPLSGAGFPLPEEMGNIIVNSLKSSLLNIFTLIRFESLAVVVLTVLTTILSYRLKPR